MTALVMTALAVVLWPDRRVADRLGALIGVPGAPVFRWGASTVPGSGGVVALAAVGLVVAVSAGPSTAVALVVLSATGWRLRVAAVDRRGQEQVMLAWEQALDRAVAAVRSGSPGGRALGEAAGPGGAGDTGREQVARILRAAQSADGLGGSASASLRGSGDPVAAELGAVWALSERHGVPLAGVLEGQRAELARRRELAGRIRAGLAGPRATAMILTALPGLGLLMGTGLGADPLAVLTGGGLGGLLGVLGAVFLSAGLWWTEKIAERAAR